MSDMLLGSTKSGSPVETRGASGAAGVTFQDLFSAPGTGGANAASIEQLLSRLGGSLSGARTPNAALATILGGGGAGVADAILGNISQSLGLDPAQRAGLALDEFDAANAPFENRAVARNAAAVRENFGSFGARFGSDVNRSVIESGAELERGFRAERAGEFRGIFEALLGDQASARDSGFRGLLGAGQLAQGQDQQMLDLLGQILGFTRPGEAVIDPGILPDIIGAGATLGGAALLG